MTRAPFFRPLALAAALAALGAAGPAHAMSDWQRECQRGTYEINPYTPCAQPFHEGLAAVMTGSEEDEAGRWGYIDKQGRMAIAPAFQEATPFQNGLAAVRQDDLWGYIDAKGAWAIRPAYAEATGFNAQGTALVRIDERDVLIDRQGQTVKTLPLGARSWGFRPGQTLAEIEVPQPPRLFNVATGRALTLPDDVMALGEPTQGQIPAQRRASRYNGWWGLLSANGRWAVPPETLRSEEAPRATATSSPCAATGAGSSWTRRADRCRSNAMAIASRCLRRAHGWSSGNTTLRRYCWTPTSGRCAASGRTMPGRKSAKAGRCCATTKRSCWSIPSAGSASCPCRKAAWTSRTVAPGSMPGPRTAPPMRRPTGRRTRRLTPPTPPSTPRRPPPTPRSPSRRPRAHGAQAQRQECRAGRGRRRGAGPPRARAGPGASDALRSIGCPILPPSRIRRRPWSSCPSPPRTCPPPGPTAMPVEAQAADAAPVAVDAAQEAGQAVDAAVAEAAVAEAAADAAAAAADAAIGSANRPETLIQIYAADGQRC